MPKSWAQYKTESRSRARAAGRCGTCCTRIPEVGSKFCAACKANNRERKTRRRAVLRERTQLRGIIDAHERAGDRALEYHLYDDAAQHYQVALNVGAISFIDRARIVEKFAVASAYSRHPPASLVQPMWQQQFFSTPQHAEHVSGTLIKMARHLWINAKTEEMLPFLARAIRLAKTHRLDHLHKRASMMLANVLFMLGRVQESARCLESLKSGDIDADDVYFSIVYCKLQGNIFAVHGAKTKAYEHFDKAVDAARSQDTHQSLGTMIDYASRALGLGDIERAKLLQEEALLIARRNHSGWFIPYYCLRYADILARMGHHKIAREYVLEALSSDASAPLLEMAVSAIGIPLALQLEDVSLLTQCTRPAAVELALHSKELARVGPVSAAFAQLYAVQGNHRKARFLLDRALEIVTYADEALDLLLAVARFGAQRQFARARALLEQRCSYPSSDVAQACIVLFDAFASKRKYQIETMQRHAMEAVERFEVLRWHGYADFARTLVPHLAPRAREPFVHSVAGFAGRQLTTREEQVVALVLKGRKNREIALELKISEHTVEKHMSSIMMRLGVRSRHQLAEVHAE